jgi:hypothetical protein
LKQISKIVLSGGLGNQLFQYSTALRLSQFGAVSLESILGEPRVNQQGEVDLLGFVLPKDVPISGAPASRIKSTLFLYTLKISSITLSRKNFVLVLNFLRSILRYILRRFAVFPDGVGFSNTDLLRNNSKYVIGNFHSYKWFDDDFTLNRLQTIHLKNEPSWFTDLKLRANLEKPIVVHVRRGDYTKIKELGILQKNYFQSALEMATISFPNSRIWIFSDNFHDAEQILPPQYSDKYFFVSQEIENSAAHLQTMRLGYCYVISNSTFSWWGAFLRYNVSAPVYCPESWFLSKPNPNSMIPNDWIRIPSK